MKLILHGTPNSRQREFFLSRARHTAYGGARGGGKSWAMRRKFVLLALRYPELNLLLLRRTLPELRENHIIPLQRELYGIAPYNSTERVFRFPNGSRINLSVMNFCREPAKPRRRSAAFSGYASSPSGQGGFAGEIRHARRRRAARVNGVPIHSNGLLGRNSVCLELLCFRFHGLCVGFFIFWEP